MHVIGDTLQSDFAEMLEARLNWVSKRMRSEEVDTASIDNFSRIFERVQSVWRGDSILEICNQADFLNVCSVCPTPSSWFVFCFCFKSVDSIRTSLNV